MPAVVVILNAAFGVVDVEGAVLLPLLLGDEDCEFELESAVWDAVEEADDPDGEEEAVVELVVELPGFVEPVAMAACWNAWKLFSGVGFTAKTIPIAQWSTGTV